MFCSIFRRMRHGVVEDTRSGTDGRRVPQTARLTGLEAAVIGDTSEDKVRTSSDERG